MKKDIREMSTWEFMFHFRDKSLFRYWGIGFKKKFVHVFYRMSKFMPGIYIAFCIQISPKY
jgi:hypothetical protein